MPKKATTKIIRRTRAAEPLRFAHLRDNGGEQAAVRFGSVNLS